MCHATWNFLLKRSVHKTTFFASASGVGSLLFMPLAVGIAVVDGLSARGALLGCVTASLHGVYGLSLSRGYRLGDLSTVYPVARGLGLGLVPVFAAILLNESVSAIGVAGIVLIGVGIYAIHVELHSIRDLLAPVRSLNTPGGRAALLTGGLIACYYLWDKNTLEHVSPVVLNQFGMTGHFLVLSPFMVGNGVGALREEWRERRLAILAAGVLIPLSWILVLVALTTSEVSYIAPAREVGIVVGATLGVVFLGEGFGMSRVWASGLIVAGVVVLAVAP